MKIELLHVFFLLPSSIFLIEGVKISPSDKSEVVVGKYERASLSCSSNGPVEWTLQNGTVLKSSPRHIRQPENLTIDLTNYSYLDTGYFICRSKNNINDTAKIYVYFFDGKNLLAMNETLVLNVTNTKVTSNNVTTLPCRPTSPDVRIELRKEAVANSIREPYDSKVGYKIITKSIDKSANYTCLAKYGNLGWKHYKIQVVVHRNNQTSPHKPHEKPNSRFSAWVKEKWYVFAGGIAVFLVILSLLIFVCLKKKRKTTTSVQGSKPAECEWQPQEPEVYLTSTHRSEPKPFEFPPEKLEYGKLLGSGVFGVIRKAEANGITEEGVNTVVAVRIYKCESDSLFMKAINNELKTMIYLGHHVNIVNLLGACTRNSPKGELSMIVEYCKYGNLRDFILKRRNNFLKQINNKNQLDLTSRRSVISENQRISVLSQGPTSESQEYLLSDSKNYDPKWDLIDYGDNSDGKNVPLKNIDFITWCFQIASGMEYLASRKIVHGDLAARNILLAEGNIVKICAIGVSKIMYEAEEYRNGRIANPIKWMAIESIKDKKFTTQSDIWSFSILMWEIYSLAISPYPGVEHAANLQDKLLSGYRLEQPKFASPEIYAIMKNCWNRDPKLRPQFPKIRERLGHLLEESIQSYHRDLNEICEETKTALEETKNYLRILESYRHPTPAENPSTLFDNPEYTVLKPLDEPEGGNNTRPNPTPAPRNEVKWSYTNGPVSYKR